MASPQPLQVLQVGRLPPAARTTVGLLLGTGLLILALVFRDTAWATLRFVVENLLAMAPIIAVAVLLSAGIAASGAEAQLSGLFRGRTLTMLLAASLFGAITPICGLGVVPIIAALLGGGVPLAPIMAFWLASPITDPAMLLVTAGTLGSAFAVGKTAIAFLIGLAGGMIVQLFVDRGFFRHPLKPAVAPAPRCGDPCAAASVSWRFWTSEPRRRLFRRHAVTSGLMIVKWLAIAFAAESFLQRYLSPDLVAAYVGADNDWAIPLAVTVGAPIYLDGYAALPLVRGLMDHGMIPGAAMAFLVAGGITSLYASMAVFALVRLPVFLWYLGLAVVGSAAGGYLFGAYAALAA